MIQANKEGKRSAAMLSTRKVLVTARPAVRSFATAPSPWGSDSWRYDKNAFKIWCTEATKDPRSKAKRELYGFLAMRFGDADVAKTGKLTPDQFDQLCEDVASLPRRFGMAPSWEKEYGSSIERRTKSRRAMFNMIDLRQGEARGWIGLEQFVKWAIDHVVTKVATIDMKEKVDFYHIEEYTQDQYLDYLEKAVTDPNSPAFASLYEFLLAIFTESDARSKGVITFEEFDALLDRSAAVPRTFGLAPPDASVAAREGFFESMNDPLLGGVTFRMFLEWTVEHSKMKIEMHRDGLGFKK